MKLNAKALALSAGIIWGLLIFLLTNISLLRGGEGEHLSRLSQFYIGYSFSFLGSLIGLVWGFVTMFIVGWVFAWLYNKLSGTPPSH
jgi:type II secretory pathway component PulF